MGILEILSAPWPWYVSGPLIGLTVPILYLIGNKAFGVSNSLRHACAAFPTKVPYFRYDWRRVGGWNLAFVGGAVLGGFVAGVPLADPNPVAIAAATQADLRALGVSTTDGIAPAALFGTEALARPAVWALLLTGGFLVGFGARYAGGCTSGHAISGLSNLQLPSLVAVAGFFVGGLFVTHTVLPWLLPALTGGPS